MELLCLEKCGILVEMILLINEKYELFMFTGFDFFIQVSKIEGCKMVRKGYLSFDFVQGSCNTFLEPTQRILLCFGDYHGYHGYRRCYT